MMKSSIGGQCNGCPLRSAKVRSQPKFALPGIKIGGPLIDQFSFGCMTYALDALDACQKELRDFKLHFRTEL